MTLVWLGSNGLQNYWQGIGAGIGSDMDKIPTPKDGDMYLDIDATELYTYDHESTDKWVQIGG